MDYGKYYCISEPLNVAALISKNKKTRRCPFTSSEGECFSQYYPITKEQEDLISHFFREFNTSEYIGFEGSQKIDIPYREYNFLIGSIICKPKYPNNATSLLTQDYSTILHPSVISPGPFLSYMLVIKACEYLFYKKCILTDNSYFNTMCYYESLLLTIQSFLDCIGFYVNLACDIGCHNANKEKKDASCPYKSFRKSHYNAIKNTYHNSKNIHIQSYFTFLRNCDWIKDLYNERNTISHNKALIPLRLTNNGDTELYLEPYDFQTLFKKNIGPSFRNKFEKYSRGFDEYINQLKLLSENLKVYNTQET